MPLGAQQAWPEFVLQIRAKKAEDELRRRLRISEQGPEMAGAAFEGLAVSEKMTHNAFSLGRAF